MSLVIATCGAQSEKIIDGVRKKVVPFVGADREGELAQLGIGLFFPDEGKGTLWGLLAPHSLIQSWRGMKILERVEKINRYTMCACWSVARRDIRDSDKQHLDELAEEFGGADKLQDLRNEVLGSVPSAEELNAMITSLLKRSVEVASWELDEEVKAGRIVASSLIEKIAREAEEQCRAHQRKVEEAKRPLLKNFAKKLTSLFR